MCQRRKGSEVAFERKREFAGVNSQVCDFCHRDFAPHLVDRVLVCYRCQHELGGLIGQREREFREELKRRAQQAKEGQKTLISE